MAKDGLIEFEGTVVDVLPKTTFTVEMSPNDLSQGRIIWRGKKSNA